MGNVMAGTLAVARAALKAASKVIVRAAMKVAWTAVSTAAKMAVWMVGLLVDCSDVQKAVYWAVTWAV